MSERSALFPQIPYPITGGKTLRIKSPTDPREGLYPLCEEGYGAPGWRLSEQPKNTGLEILMSRPQKVRKPERKTVMKSTSIMALGLLFGLVGCGPTQQDLALQAQIKDQAQDNAARAELGACNQQYPSPVSRGNAVAKFQCMNTAYHHFSRKTDQIDEDYFNRNMALATRYAAGEISYDDMEAGIAKNAADLTRQRTVLTYQAGMAQAAADDMAERMRAAKAARGAARDAAESDSPDAD